MLLRSVPERRVGETRRSSRQPATGTSEGRGVRNGLNGPRSEFSSPALGFVKPSGVKRGLVIEALNENPSQMCPLVGGKAKQLCFEGLSRHSNGLEMPPSTIATRADLGQLVGIRRHNELHFSCGGVRHSRAIRAANNTLRGCAALTPRAATNACYGAAGSTAAQGTMPSPSLPPWGTCLENDLGASRGAPPYQPSIPAAPRGSALKS